MEMKKIKNKFPCNFSLVRRCSNHWLNVFMIVWIDVTIVRSVECFLWFTPLPILKIGTSLQSTRNERTKNENRNHLMLLQHLLIILLIRCDCVRNSLRCQKKKEEIKSWIRFSVDTNRYYSRRFDWWRRQCRYRFSATIFSSSLEKRRTF